MRDSDRNGFITYARRCFGNKLPAQFVWKGYSSWFHTCQLNLMADFGTKEAAMDDLDKKLIENGYILLTTKQANKLLPLL